MFAELPAELDALLAEVQATLKTGSPDEIASASHRLGGLADHFGLSEVAAESRRLERGARNLPFVADAAAAAEAALSAAARRIDWSAFDARLADA